MSSQRKKSGRPVPRAAKRGEGNAFAVVVEQLRGEFKVFGEALQGVEARLGHTLREIKVDVALLQDASTQHTRELKGLRQSLAVVDDHERRISALEKRTG